MRFVYIQLKNALRLRRLFRLEGPNDCPSVRLAVWLLSSTLEILQQFVKEYARSFVISICTLKKER